LNPPSHTTAQGLPGFERQVGCSTFFNFVVSRCKRKSRARSSLVCRALHDHMDFKAGLPPLAPTMAGTIACINRKRLRAFYK
jgi:hypothetical protein